jgi:NAD(P)-dependent dehydrogenase (short-subunit alcohol dehydrogenase family)
MLTWGQSVVNNAGICTEAADPRPIYDVDEDQFDAHMRINARGVFLGSKYSVKQFLNQEPRANGMRGWIVNFASMVSNIGMRGVSKLEPSLRVYLTSSLHIAAGYTASKGAVAAMTRTIALDVAKLGIVANCIAPGCKSICKIRLHASLT